MSDSSHLLQDIGLELRRASWRPVYRVRATIGPAASGRREIDLATASGDDNLGQAVIMRLLTPRGELAELGHPAYGSRVHELIGERNTDTLRELLRLYILEALAMEPRIDEIVQLEVRPHSQIRSLVEVTLLVRPVGRSRALTIGPFNLELES